MNPRFHLLPTHDSDRPTVDGITIDGPDSMDLDDAIWLDEIDGQYRITVSIADVAAGIPVGSALDRRAWERGATRYFANGNAPMFPRDLSEDSLSLLPGQRRRVLCIQILLDGVLDPREVYAFHAWLTVTNCLSHAMVGGIIENRIKTAPPELRSMLKELAALTGRLLEKRRARGELALYDFFSGWTLSEEGTLRELPHEQRNIGYLVVQELMILANRTLAELLVDADVPALYRNHTVRAATPERSALLANIQSVVLRPDVYDIETLRKRLLLLVGRARYGPDLLGHFGLNLPAYLHFTSPIRRYADLVNHRVLSALLEGRASPYTRLELIEIGDYLNSLRDEEIERRSESYKQKAEVVAKSLVDAPPERITALSDNEFYRVLEAADREALPEGLRKAVLDRLEGGTISIKEVLFLLFQSQGDSEEWVELRHTALEWLRKRPFHAVSLVIMGAQAKAWTPARYQYSQDSERFWCTVSLVWGSERIDSGAQSAATKKAAQQLAALALCNRLLGIGPSPIPEGISPEKEITPKLKSGPTLSKSEQRRNAGTQRSQELAAEGDWVSALWLLLNSRLMRLPRVIYRVDKEPGEEAAHCRMSIVWGGHPLEADGIGPTRQQAKQQAARSLWQRVQRNQAEKINE